MDVFEKNFEALDRLLPDGLPAFLAKEEANLRLKAVGYMDLVVEKLGPASLSLAHYYEQNGDLMADPEMELRVDVGRRLVEALSYRQDGLGIYQVVYPDAFRVFPAAKRQQNSFLSTWLRNLRAQGFGRRSS